MVVVTEVAMIFGLASLAASNESMTVTEGGGGRNPVKAETVPRGRDSHQPYDVLN